MENKAEFLKYKYISYQIARKYDTPITKQEALLKLKTIAPEFSIIGEPISHNSMGVLQLLVQIEPNQDYMIIQKGKFTKKDKEFNELQEKYNKISHEIGMKEEMVKIFAGRLKAANFNEDQLKLKIQDLDNKLNEKNDENEILKQKIKEISGVNQEKIISKTDSLKNQAILSESQQKITELTTKIESLEKTVIDLKKQNSRYKSIINQYSQFFTDNKLIEVAAYEKKISELNTEIANLYRKINFNLMDEKFRISQNICKNTASLILEFLYEDFKNEFEKIHKILENDKKIAEKCQISEFNGHFAKCKFMHKIYEKINPKKFTKLHENLNKLIIKNKENTMILVTNKYSTEIIKNILSFVNQNDTTSQKMLENSEYLNIDTQF